MAGETRRGARRLDRRPRGESRLGSAPRRPTIPGSAPAVQSADALSAASHAGDRQNLGKLTQLGVCLMSAFIQDVRYAVRTLKRSAGVTFVIVASLRDE